MNNCLKHSNRLKEVAIFSKDLFLKQDVLCQSLCAAFFLLLLSPLYTFRCSFIFPIYIFFVASFIAGVLIVDHNTFCPNFMLTYARPIKKAAEKELMDEMCHVCGKSDCGRHRVELSTESFQPWLNLEIPEALNDALEKFFDLLLKEYVEAWYNDVSNDEALTDEIKKNIRFAVAVCIRRLKKVDLASLISGKVLTLSMRHLNHCLNALESWRTGDKCAHEDLQQLQQLEQKLIESYGSDLHVAVRSRQLEMLYLSSLSQQLLISLLPSPSLNSKTFHVLMREMLAGIVLLPSIDLLADPDTINNLLLLFLEEDACVAAKEEGQESRMVPVLQGYQCRGAFFKSKTLQVRLSSLLSSPDLLYPFMQFMKAQHSVNVLQFYLVIEEFNRKILTPDLGGDKLLELHLELRKLYDTFFEPSAKDCIRFESDLTAQIKNICEGPAEEVIKLQTTAPLFRAYEHTYDLLEHTFLPLFHQSDIYYSMLCGERLPAKMLKKETSGGLKRGSTSESLSKLSNKIKGVFKSSAVDGTRLNDEVDYDVEEVQVSAEQAVDSNAEDEEEEEEDDDVTDLSLWVVSIPSLHVDRKNTLFHVEVKRLVDHKEGEPEEWSIERRYNEFYVLETKLKEFHGLFEDCQLPGKRTFVPKDKSFFEALRPELESFLRILLTKPTLRGSQLLHSFLTSQHEFTTSILDVNLGKKVKSGAMKLVREKGQHLEAFLKSFLLSTEAPKSKPLKSADLDSDSVSLASEKTVSSMYGNNANLPDLAWPSPHQHVDLSFGTRICSYFDALLYLYWKLFMCPQWLLQLLWSLRTLARRSLDCLMDWYVAEKLKDALKEQQLLKLLQLLRDALFNDNDNVVRSEEDKARRQRDAFEALHSYIPNCVTTRHTESGLRLLFSLLQLPRLNKQLAYVLLDMAALELFPELEAPVKTEL